MAPLQQQQTHGYLVGWSSCLHPVVVVVVVAVPLVLRPELHLVMVHVTARVTALVTVLEPVTEVVTVPELGLALNRSHYTLS